MLAYWLLGLAPVLATIYIVWAYRKKTAARAATRSERMDRIFGGALQGAGVPGPTRGPARSLPSQPSATQRSGEAPAIYVRKARLLDKQRALLVSSLRSALPEYEVFPQINLGSVVDVPPAVQGRDREQRLRALGQHVIDCLVCNGEMQVIAAVELEGGDGASRQFKSECLKAAGMRYVLMSPEALSKPGGLRMPVLADAENVPADRHVGS